MKIKTGKHQEFDSTEFERPLIEEGLYGASLKEVKEISDGKYGARVAFVYTISEKNVDLVSICYVPEKATPDNKFGQTLLAHGVNLDKGEEIDTDSIIGVAAKVLVETYEYDDKKEDGTSEKKKASVISKVKSLTQE